MCVKSFKEAFLERYFFYNQSTNPFIIIINLNLPSRPTVENYVCFYAKYFAHLEVER